MAENKRASSAGYEVYRLRETVARLNGELITLRAAVQKGQQQLGCLTNLVKRAWTGDAAAAIHVANIVGVAPPLLTVGDSADGRKIVMAHLKHISPWKSTGSGKEDNDSAFESTKRLIQRTAYLDEQMQEHRTLRSPSLGVPRRGSAARPYRPVSQPAATTTATTAATRDSTNSSDKLAQEPHVVAAAAHELSPPSPMDSPVSTTANKSLGKRSTMVSEQDISDINALLTTAMLSRDKDAEQKLAGQTTLCGWTQREPPSTAFKLFHQTPATLGGTRQQRPKTAFVGKPTAGKARPCSAEPKNSPRFGRLFLTGGASKPDRAGDGTRPIDPLRSPAPESRRAPGPARHNKPASGRAKLSALIFADDSRRLGGGDASGGAAGADDSQRRRRATLLQKRLGIADAGLV